MPFEANQKYHVTVTAARLRSSSTGTPALELTFRHEEHGEIKGRLWLSAKAAPYSKKTLIDVFGVSPARLADPAFFEEADMFLRDLPCWITTEADNYNGSELVKVRWIDKTEYPETPDVDQKTLAAQAAAALAAATAAAAAPSFGRQQTPPDDDVPF